MIPRIAHFHWEEGLRWSWLRSMSISTFMRHNPEWDVMFHRTPKDIRDRGLAELAHNGDWTLIRRMSEFGGFFFGTDTVFVAPVPDEWLDADMCICPGESRPLHHMTIGSIPDTEFLDNCLDECERLATLDEIPDEPRFGRYQAFGIGLLTRVWDEMGGMKGMKISEMPRRAYTPVEWCDPLRLWRDEDVNLPEGTIGVHWFGGHPESMRLGQEAKPGDSAFIVRLAEGVFA